MKKSFLIPSFKINQLFNPTPIHIANAVRYGKKEWKWDYIVLDDILGKKSFVVYFYVAKKSREILKVGDTSGKGGLISRVAATANGDKGDPGGHDKKMQPIIRRLLDEGFEIELHAFVYPAVEWKYKFQGVEKINYISDSTSMQDDYISLIKDKTGVRPPFNFEDNKGRRTKDKDLELNEQIKNIYNIDPTTLSKSQRTSYIQELDVEVRYQRAKELCQNV